MSSFVAVRCAVVVQWWMFQHMKVHQRLKLHACWPVCWSSVRNEHAVLHGSDASWLFYGERIILLHVHRVVAGVAASVYGLRLWAGQSGFDTQCGRNFSLLAVSAPALEPTDAPVQRYRYSFPLSKPVGKWTWHSTAVSCRREVCPGRTFFSVLYVFV